MRFGWILATPLVVLFLFLLIPIQAQPVAVNYFRLEPDGADVLVVWEMQDEESVVEFKLFRRIDNNPELRLVTSIRPTGQKNYQFLDDEIFKAESLILYYELHVVTKHSTVKFSQTISHNPTSIQRTWGSIKAMFRG